MSTYLKLFQTTAEYDQYISSAEALHPNTSLCLDTEKVHYEPIPEFPDDELVIIKVNNGYGVPTTYTIYRDCLDDDTTPNACEHTGAGGSAFYGLNNFSFMKINDGDWQPAEKTAELQPGENTIKFQLIDKTLIPAGVFKFETSEPFITFISIPKTVTQIEYNAFVTARLDIWGVLKKLVIYAETPPTAIKDHYDNWDALVYYSNPEDGVFVPAESVELYRNNNDWSYLNVNFNPIE